MKFSEALDRKLEDIQRPPNLPVGHYIWTVSKHPDVEEFESKAGDTFERVTFQISCIGAGEDVDADELAEYGNPNGALNRKSFMFATGEDKKADFERSMFNLRRFLGHCGVDEDLALSEALAASVGSQFLGEIRHRADPNDPEIVYSEVGVTAEV